MTAKPGPSNPTMVRDRDCRLFSTPDGNGDLHFIRRVLDDGIGDTGKPFSTLAFSTRNPGIPLQTGLFANARRYPFEPAGQPGIAVSRQNRGSNMLLGEFAINHLGLFVDSGYLIVGRIVINFEQHSELACNPALFGNIFCQQASRLSPNRAALSGWRLCVVWESRPLVFEIPGGWF